MNKRTKFLLPIMLLLFSGCVYYNTFFNAESAFNSGLKSQLKRKKNATSDSITPVTDAEKQKFNRAIEKASKVLDVYPHKMKWADDAIFLIGRSYYQMEEYSKAIRKFEELLVNYGTSPFVPDARMLMAKSYLYKKDYEKALEEFERFGQNHPNHPANAEIPLLLAEISLGQGTRFAAIEQLKKAREESPRKQRTAIDLRIARLYFEAKKYEEAFKETKGIEVRYLEYNELYSLRMMQARCMRMLKQYEEALGILKILRNDNRFDDRSAETLIESGRCREDMGQHEEALAIYQEAAQLQGQTDQVAIANYLAAKIFQKRYADFDSALVYYIGAEKSSNTEIRDDARLMKKSIAKLNELLDLFRPDTSSLSDFNAMPAIGPLSDTGRSLDSSSLPDAGSWPDSIIPKDTVAARDTIKKAVHLPGQAQFQIAEIYWLRLELPDSSLIWFNRVVSDSLADSLFAPQAAYAAAWILRKEFSDTARSDSCLNLILKRYPFSPQAKGAQKELGLSVTIVTRADTVAELYRLAENALWDKHQPKKAAAGFDSIHSQYKDIELAPQAAYASAWIHDEIIDDSAKAYDKYEYLYKTWPKTLYGESAEKKLKAVITAAGEVIEANEVEPGKVPQNEGGTRMDQEADPARQEMDLNSRGMDPPQPINPMDYPPPE